MDDFDTLRHVRAPAGFADAVLRQIGLLDRYAVVRSALGVTYVALSDEGVTAVSQADDDEAFVARYRERFGRKLERRDDLALELEDLVNNRCGEARVDLRGCNAFAREVLEATRRIPEGAVRPYNWVAQAIGRPGAVRAVGTALKKNPVPLVIPCHRVVRGDGSAGAYAFGANRKTELLEREHVDLDEVRRRMNLRTVWSAPGEDTFCRPYCFVARPIPPDKMLQYESERAARDHGLTPCTTCHPAAAA